MLRETDHPLRELAAADAKGIATEEERRILREDLHAFKDAVTELRQDLQAQFTERKAVAQEYQNECFSMGYAGKARWFDFKAEYKRWQGVAQRYLQGLDRLNREINTLKREQGKIKGATPEERAERRRRSAYPLLQEVEQYLQGDSTDRGQLLERVTTWLAEQDAA